MEPSAIDSLYGDLFDVSVVGSKATMRDRDQFYTSLQDDDNDKEDADEDPDEDADAVYNDSGTGHFISTPLTTRRKR